MREDCKLQKSLFRALRKCKFVAFDIETTGLIAFSARIIEIAGVRILDGKVSEDKFSMLVNPQIHIPEEASRIHGITDEDVRGAPSEREVIAKFESWVGSDAILVAHNAPYDLEILSSTYARINRPLPHLICIDTCAWARASMRLSSSRLSFLAKALSLPFQEFHRALSDAITTANLFVYLAEKFGFDKSIRDLMVAYPEAVISEFPTFALLPSEIPEGLLPIVEALEDGGDVVMVYGGGTMGRRQRRVSPRAIIRKGGVKYMEAWCYESGRTKRFRLDKIISVVPVKKIQ